MLTLTIGLGANTALYGLIEVLLLPLALPHPEQIVAIVAEAKGDETGGFQFHFSTEQLEDFQERAEPFSDVVGLMPGMAIVSGSSMLALIIPANRAGRVEPVTVLRSD